MLWPMPYRDHRLQCISCGTGLTDFSAAGGSIKRCGRCGGAWVQSDELAAMFNYMNWQARPTFVAGAPGADRHCLDCGGLMVTAFLEGVHIDHCSQHGTWFDASELQRILEMSADLDRARTNPVIELTDARAMRFRIFHGREFVDELIVSHKVVKIGRLSSSHIRLDDRSVARMHAVVECAPDNVSIIDLGSSVGTLVNGYQVNRASLESGDVIGIADYMLAISFAPAPDA